MNYLSAENLSKAYGLKILFKDLTFGISKGQKVALVGRNGCGKTSLLRILAGKDAPDSGSLSIRKNIRTEFLDQAPEFDPSHNVRQALFSGDNPTLQLIAEYETLIQEENPDPNRLQKLMEDMETHEAWDLEVRTHEILDKLGIGNLIQPVRELSGGQCKRLALARTLLNEPDFLVLDEPTNHLDTEIIEWLEKLLSASNMTLVMVTHDRYFLDRICNEILELEQGQLHYYHGNYSFFLEKKNERISDQNMEVTKAQNLLRKELEWLRRQPKARTTKSKARIDSVHQLQEKAGAGLKDQNIQMNFQAKRIGNSILELDKVCKSWDGQKMVDNFSYVFKKAERIGIVGPNGVGKTTFLNMITGNLKPDSGTIETGQTIQFGYYTQAGLQFSPGDKVIDIIQDAAEFITLASGDQISASGMLTLFGFPPPVQYNQVRTLSGGEMRRLHLLRVLMAQPNFLILDEPTNDLDIITLNTLEEFLMGFGGCLIIVSHDRYFLDKLADHLFVFEGEGIIKPYPGNFREYRAWKAEQDTPIKPKEVEKPKTERVQNRDKKISFKEQREYETLAAEINTLQKRKEEVMNLINSGSTDHKALTDWGNEVTQLKKALSEKEDRWLELAEMIEEASV